ncbi:hypothetical protein FKM82_029565 [Ascaphus truei]
MTFITEKMTSMALTRNRSVKKMNIEIGFKVYFILQKHSFCGKDEGEIKGFLIIEFLTPLLLLNASSVSQRVRPALKRTYGTLPPRNKGIHFLPLSRIKCYSNLNFTAPSYGVNVTTKKKPPSYIRRERKIRK